MPDSPAPADGLSPDWLTQTLCEAGVIGDARIRSFNRSHIGPGRGLSGEIVRIQPVYSRGAPGAPTSLVGKFPPANEQAHTVGEMLRLYEREVRFYDEIAERAGVATPRCYYAGDGFRPGDRILLLEDLEPAEVGDQVAGWTANQAETAIRNLARFHAHWWDSREIDELHWMPDWNSAPLIAMVSAAYGESWDRYVANFGELLPDDILDVGRRLGPAIPELAGRLAQPPATMAHGDYRMDNLFFGGPDGGRDFVAIDWQMAARGRGACDLAIFITQSGPRRLRRSVEDGLIRLYCDTLRDNGVRHYDFETCYLDYRRATLYGLVYPVISGGGMDVNDARGKALLRAVTRRVVEAVLDHDAGSLI